uniref:Uncharacterized protein n=1 Tax=Rhizobium rhizogenes TaxID=359 RepID=A0A7S4ZSK2_RHIRH|nr:hypothetical protein pC6.5b_474 [Rhizobium rhizogenes]
MLLMNAEAAGRSQFVDLSVIELIIGRNAGIANQFVSRPSLAEPVSLKR